MLCYASSVPTAEGEVTKLSLSDSESQVEKPIASNGDTGTDDRDLLEGYLGVSESGQILKHLLDDPDAMEIANLGL